MTRPVVSGAALVVFLAWLGGTPRAQQGQAGAPQPGLTWSDDELNKVAHHVRAGRKLTPKTWPNGARVAVCLSFDPDNFSIALNRGDNAPVTISEGEYGALTGIPRILRLLDKHNV